MADTTRWTLQQCADAAGKRTAVAAEVAYVPPPRRCLACGADLGARRGKAGLYIVYCGQSCAAEYRRRRGQHVEVERDLTLTRYSW